jgi:hypothetical protein
MRYTINPGHGFLDGDGSVKSGGQTIELSDEAAAAHRDKVTACSDAEAAPQDGDAAGEADEAGATHDTHE